MGLRGAVAESINESVSLISDPGDPIASSPQCRWALKEMSQALEAHRVRVGQYPTLQQAPQNSWCVVASASDREPAANLLKASGVTLANRSESLALVPFAKDSRHGILATGDVRGLMYALLEL